ncbi:MAG: MlaD family protein [Fibrobacterota bacterium]
MALTTAQKTRLGIFMTAGTALVIFFILIPVGLSLTSGQHRYFTIFGGESLSGLEEGASVKFHGIPVGKVEKISYQPHNLSEVRASLLIDDDFPVKEDMYIQTGMVGITGLKYIEILGGSDTSDIIKPDSEIDSRPSLMANITGKTDIIIEKVELLLNNITDMTHPDSLAYLKKAVKNLSVITDSTRMILSDLSPAIKEMGGSASGAMSDVAEIAASVNKITSGLSDDLSTDRISRIVMSTDSASRNIRDISSELSLIIRQAKEDFKISMENLREASENANEISSMLRENPSLIIRERQVKERAY